MGIFTGLTGNRVDSTLGPFPFHTCWGPWKWNGAYYCAVYSDTSFWANVYKSTDGGSTWTAVAQVSSRFDISPYQQYSSTQFVTEPAFDAVNGKIYWCHTQRSGSYPTFQYRLAMACLDLATETWDQDLAGIGPEFAQEYLPANGLGCSLAGHRAIAVRSNGNVIVYYASRTGGTESYFDLYCVELDVLTNSWGSPQLVSALVGEHSIPFSAVQPSGTNTHVFFASWSESYVGYVPTTGAATLRHCGIDQSGTLGTPDVITTDYTQSCWFYTGNPACDPTTNKLVVVVGGEGTEPEDSWKTLHWVWTADEALNPSWSMIASSLPFPGTVSDYNLGWVESLTHAYGDTDFVSFYDGSTLKVIGATYHYTSGSDPDETWLWEFSWDGATWSYEQLDNFASGSSPYRYFGSPSVVKHSDGWGLMVARWCTDSPTNQQQAWSYIRSNPGKFAYFGTSSGARKAGQSAGWFT